MRQPLRKSSNTNKKLIAELRDQLDKAHATICQLNQLLRAQSRYPLEQIKLSPTQRKIVDILLQTDGICTKEHLYDALYASKKDQAPDPKILREILRLIRKKLRPYGIEIVNLFGKGYSILDVSRAKLNILISQLKPEHDIVYRGVNFTPTQQKVIYILMHTNGICTKKHLYEALYAVRQGYKPDPKVLDELLRVIRRQLDPLGIEITTIFGKGYMIPVESKTKLKELIIS